MVNNPYARYKESSTSTASKEELTLMLYDGALKFCNQAIAAINEKDYIKANTLIIKIEDIIQEFQLTLNKKYEISKEFELLYDYMFRRLLQANIKKDVTILEEMRDLLREFRDTWKQAIILAKKSR